jgi:hypothetical protein
VEASDAEFDRLQSKKDEILRKKVEARVRLRKLAWEVLATQKEQEALDKDLEKIHAKQEEMIEEEARFLEELDTFTGMDPEGPIALMSDEFFSWDDSSLALLQGPGDTPVQTSG